MNVDLKTVASVSRWPALRAYLRGHDPDLWTDRRGLGALVTGDTVCLTGQVRCREDCESAERAAGQAPGITRVDNLVVVVPNAG